MYGLYSDKLERHITEKEQMIMEINVNKTEQTIEDLYDRDRIGDVDYYRSFTQAISRQHQHLNHGKSEVMAKINTEFYLKAKGGNNNPEYAVMKAIDKIKSEIRDKSTEYD